MFREGPDERGKAPLGFHGDSLGTADGRPDGEQATVGTQVDHPAVARHGQPRTQVHIAAVHLARAQHIGGRRETGAPLAVLNLAPPRAHTRSAGLRDRARAQAGRRATSDVNHSAAEAGDALPHTARTSPSALLVRALSIRRASGHPAGSGLKRRDADLIPGVEEAEAQSGAPVEQTQARDIHVTEQDEWLSGYGGEDNILEQRPGQRPDVSAGPDRVDTAEEPRRPRAPGRLEFCVVNMLAEPRGETFAVVVDNVVVQAVRRAIYPNSLSKQAFVVLAVPPVHELNVPRTAIPATVTDSRPLENEPEPMRVRGTSGLLQGGRRPRRRAGGKSTGQRRRNRPQSCCRSGSLRANSRCAAKPGHGCSTISAPCDRATGDRVIHGAGIDDDYLVSPGH